MRILKDKRGGEKYLSIWWFFVLAVIGTGIVIGVSVLNIADRNTKELESEILVSRVVDCLVDNGYLNQQFLDGRFDIFESCYLSEEVINRSEKHYLSLEVYDSESCKIENGEFECKNPLEKTVKSFGVSAFETQCGTEGKHYPLCYEKYIYVLDEKNEKLILYVKAGSNQVIKREV